MISRITVKGRDGINNQLLTSFIVCIKERRCRDKDLNRTFHCY